MDEVDDFTVLIEDDRSSVFGLRFVQARGAARAAQIADRIMAESAHYTGVEVWARDALIYTAGSARRVGAEAGARA